MGKGREEGRANVRVQHFFGQHFVQVSICPVSINFVLHSRHPGSRLGGAGQQDGGSLNAKPWVQTIDIYNSVVQTETSAFIIPAALPIDLAENFGG